MIFSDKSNEKNLSLTLKKKTKNKNQKLNVCKTGSNFENKAGKNSFISLFSDKLQWVTQHFSFLKLRLHWAVTYTDLSLLTQGLIFYYVSQQFFSMSCPKALSYCAQTKCFKIFSPTSSPSFGLRTKYQKRKGLSVPKFQ